MQKRWLFVPAFCLLVLPSSPKIPNPGDEALTAKDIIANCARAMGGREKIDRLKTLRIFAVWPDHGDKPLGLEIMRPNKSYLPQGRLAYDGRRACFLNGEDGRSKPEMVDEAELVDYDVEIALYFPAFFDYPAEYAGTEILAGRPAHKLRVALRLGAVITYYIDAETWLPIRARNQFRSKGRDFDNTREYRDFRNVGGIVYPHAFTYPSRDRKSVLLAAVTSVEINPPLDPAHFVIPDIK